MPGPTPAQTAKAALRRLALSQQEPTPENYARAYAEELGGQVGVLPDRARPLLERMAARHSEDPARRDELVGALMQARWDVASQLLDRSSQSVAAQAQAWAQLIERLARALQRPSRQWTAGRRNDSLQRVLDGSRSDLQRLQQRLASLVGAWESDAPVAAADGAPAAPGAPATAPMPLTDEPMPAAPAPAPGEADAPAWPDAVGEYRRTLVAALPERDARAADLADRLGELADRLADRGPDAQVLQDLAQTCAEVRRLFAHRAHLHELLSALCIELGQGLAELAEDESWARGQAQNLQARLAEGVSARSVRAATEILADTRQRHARVRAEREQARNALKQLIHRMLEEIGELGEHTGRFDDALGRHVRAIEAADSIEGLAGVVRELVDDSRAVRELVRKAQQRMVEGQERAGRLEAQVRALEDELRKLSDEVSTDALTQVANRRGLMTAFAAESDRRREAGAEAPLAVALIDIDNFKKLNDTLGHAAGDRALQSLAAAVRERLRPQDHLARFGGEEFVVLLPSTPLEQASQALTRLQRSLSAALFMHDEKEVFVTFSAGVTEWRPPETLESALERADEALYEAKRTGKNRTCVV